MRDGKGPGLRVGRMIGWMAGFALFCLGATTYMVRAAAEHAVRRGCGPRHRCRHQRR
jgi:hypothetical protein